MKPTVIFMLFLWNLVEFTLTLEECSKLPSVKHAFVLDEYKKTEYQRGDVIYFCCDPGFTTGLNNTYICNEDGWRPHANSECVEESFNLRLACTPPPPLTHGYLLLNTTLIYGNGDKATYRCDDHYTRSGGSFKTCTNGQWTGDIQCIFLCGRPDDVPFADFKLVRGTDFIFGSQVQYTCHRGYQMTSFTDTRNCLQGGWDGHLPVCEPISCPPVTLKEHVMVNGDIDNPTSGSVLQFSCRGREYEIVGEHQIFCDEHGQWSSASPSCKIISCPEPPLKHFRITNKKDVYREGDVLTYMCDENYKKVDGRPSRCEKVGQSAQWTPMPHCEPVTCKVSADPPWGTSYSPRDRIIFTPGESVTVTCGEKQWVKSTELQTAPLICKSTGVWDFDPVCQLVKCLKNDPLVSWWERHRDQNYPYYYINSATMGETARYTCYRGLEEADTRATCTRQGWEPNPLCAERSCTKPSYKNAEINDYYQYEKYSHGADVSFRCTHEYRTFYARCNKGRWENSAEPCKGKPCTTQPTVEHGELRQNVRPPYEDGATVRFRCTGETQDFKVTCDSGQWHSDKSCKVIPCTEPPKVKNAEMDEPVKPSYAHGQVVTLRCSTGVKETFPVSCQSGKWIIGHECSEQIGCSGSEIVHGYSHEYNNTLYYTCYPEYKLLGKGWWDKASCEDGEWKTQECVDKSDCGPVPEIPNLNVTNEGQRFKNGSTVQIVCEPGYHNPNIKQLTCIDGKWSRNKDEKVDFKSICTPIHKICRPPPKVRDALILAPFEKEYLSGSILKYHCRNDYIMKGNGIICCKDGKWEQESISCIGPQPPQSEE